MLEIGPGIGSLTVALLDAGATVTALELDRHVIPALEETVGAGAVRVVNGDALRVDLGDRDAGGRRAVDASSRTCPTTWRLRSSCASSTTPRT